MNLSGESIKLGRFPVGTKVALSSLSVGQELIKYSQNIGFAKADIEAGEWVHTHNVEQSQERLRIL